MIRMNRKKIQNTNFLATIGQILITSIASVIFVHCAATYLLRRIALSMSQ